MKAYHEERQKKHDRAEYAREKFRENIRQKYGIGRKSAESMDASDMTLQVSCIFKKEFRKLVFFLHFYVFFVMCEMFDEMRKSTFLVRILQEVCHYE